MNSQTLGSEEIRKEIEVFKRRCEALIVQFEVSEDVGERTRIADEYSHALNQLEASHFLLEMVEKQEKANRLPAAQS